MLGKSVINGRSSSTSNSRVFVYEVMGLKQNEANDSNDYSIRSSSSVFVTVPYNRMNEEMQRIGKMGGNIVNIQSLADFKQAEAEAEAEAQEEVDNQEDNNEQN